MLQAGTMAEAATAAEAGPSPTMLSQLRDRFFGTSVRQDGRLRFEQAVLPHMDAAYNLARWLTKHDADAEDVVQTACLKAFQGFDGFRGVNPRAWLLAIVRNTFYSWLAERGRGGEAAEFDEAIHSEAAAALPSDPEVELLRQADGRLLARAFAELALPFREVIVLREIEGLSYKEIAGIAGIPIGTVMSRLARARRDLREFLLAHGVKEGRP
jgi:RNA polymerase sigma factor (sigma-70 family)